jgi:hypothetical protein
LQLLFVGVFCLLIQNRVQADEAWRPSGDGWISLFNGKDLAGWKTPAQDHTWKVIDGVIDYEAKGGSLATEQQFGDYKLHIEWRFKRTAGPPYTATLVDADGNPQKDAAGKPITKSFPNADSGIFVRGSGSSQVNLWCWPCGSGQLWSFRNHKDPAIRKGAWPSENADKPVGEWNTMEITLIGERITIVNNGVTISENTQMPGIPSEGSIVLQHHGGFNEKTGEWKGASSLVQFRNIWIKPLSD